MLSLQAEWSSLYPDGSSPTTPPFQINTTYASISDAVFAEPQILIMADENGLPRTTYRVWFTSGTLTVSAVFLSWTTYQVVAKSHC